MSKSAPLTTLVNFFYEIGNARKQQRRWESKIGVPMANVAEHTYRTAFLAMHLAAAEGGNPERAAFIALVHDTEEIRTGDLDPFQKMYVSADGDKAITDLFANILIAATCLKAFKEYKSRASLEAKCVKDADILDTVIELHEIAARGTQYLELIPHQVAVKRERYFTDSARALHDAIIKAGPQATWDWFLKGESTFSQGTYGK